MNNPVVPRIEVLNSGYVELVESMGDDGSPIRSARVSYAGDLRSGNDIEGDNRLRRYLLKNGHTSPFESVTFTFRVHAPIFVLRQWHRHRTWSFNEVSARYTILDAQFYFPEIRNITTQSESNKQMRTDTQHPDAGRIQEVMLAACEDAVYEYNRLLELGCPRELARTVLPLATYTRMYATVNLHNLMRFWSLRLHPHAQYEIRVYAQATLDLARTVVPHTVALWEELCLGKD